MLTISPGTGTTVSKVIVEGVRFDLTVQKQLPEDEIPAILLLDRCQEVAVRSCEMRLISSTPLPIIGVLVRKSGNVEIRGNGIRRCYSGVWGTDGTKGSTLTVSENAFIGAVIGEAATQVPASYVGIWAADDITQSCRIEGNSFKNYLTGIHIGKTGERSLIAGNNVLRGSVAAQGSDEKIYGIYADAPYCVIKENYLNLANPGFGGILAAGSNSIVERNELQSELQETADKLPLGIYLGPPQGSKDLPPNHGTVKENRLSGILDGIQISGGDVGIWNVRLLGNRMVGDAKTPGRTAVSVLKAFVATLADNWIQSFEFGISLVHGTGNQVLRNSLSNGGVGIFGWYENHPVVFGNIVDDMKYYGIGCDSCIAVKLADNLTAWCGYDLFPNWPSYLPTFGIGFLNTSDITVESCEVFATGSSVDGKTLAKSSTSGIFALFATDFLVRGNRVFGVEGLNPDLEHSALFLFGYPEPGTKGSAEVVENRMMGMGSPNLVRLPAEFNVEQKPINAKFIQITFSNNICEQTKVREVDEKRKTATVLLAGDYVSAVGNQVKADDKKLVSIWFEFEKAYLTVVSNITSGSCKYSTSQIKPKPLEDFNHIGVL